MSDNNTNTLPPIDTCRIKTGIGYLEPEGAIKQLRNEIEDRYGTRDFREAQRRIFVIEHWKHE